MRLSRLHDSSARDFVAHAVRAVRRMREPLMRAPDDLANAPPESASQERAAKALRVGPSRRPEPLYGTLTHAEREFERHGRLDIESLHVDERILLLAGLAASQDPGARVANAVIDVGGSTGLHRRQLDGLPLVGSLSWTVVETEAYRQVALERGRPDVRWTTSVDDAVAQLRDVDGLVATCVYSNSALQYFDDPLGELARWATSGARAIVIERVPFLTRTGPARVVEQYLPGSDVTSEQRARVVLAALGSVLDALEEHGFSSVAVYPVHGAAFRLGRQFVSTYSIVAVKPSAVVSN